MEWYCIRFSRWFIPIPSATERRLFACKNGHRFWPAENEMLFILVLVFHKTFIGIPSCLPCLNGECKKLSMASYICHCIQCAVNRIHCLLGCTGIVRSPIGAATVDWTVGSRRCKNTHTKAHSQTFFGRRLVRYLANASCWCIRGDAMTINLIDIVGVRCAVAHFLMHCGTWQHRHSWLHRLPDCVCARLCSMPPSLYFI